MALPGRIRSPQLPRLSFAALIAILIGLTTGLGSFAFYYGKGYSYLSQDPAACANCHVMRPQFDSWQKSSHHAVAVCNDCHTPEGAIAKYATKAENGFWHSWAFTTQNFHEPIQIKPSNKVIAQNACLKCHSGMFADVTHPAGVHSQINQGDDMTCTHCHKNIGH